MPALPWSRGIDRNGTWALWAAASAYVFFGLLDCLTSIVALADGFRERNPLASRLYAQYGPVSLFALKGVVVATIIVVLAGLPRRLAAWVATCFAAAVAIAVIGNLHALQVH